MLRTFAVALFFLGFALVPAKASEGIQAFQFDFSDSSIQIAPGNKKTVGLRVQMKQAGAYIHPKAPFKIDLESKGVQIEKKAFEQSDAIERSPKEKARDLVFEVPLSASKAGSYSVDAKLEFFFCTAKICEKREASANLNVLVKS